MAGGFHVAGAATAVATGLLIVWTTIVRDNGQGIGPLMLVLAAGVGAFTALLRAAAMARAMIGLAAMQLLLGVAEATAPSTAAEAGGVVRVLLFNGAFALSWGAAALCFRRAAHVQRDASLTGG